VEINGTFRDLLPAEIVDCIASQKARIVPVASLGHFEDPCCECLDILLWHQAAYLIGDDLLRPAAPRCEHRCPAGQCFNEYSAKGLGPAWQHQQRALAHVTCQLVRCLHAGKLDVAIETQSRSECSQLLLLPPVAFVESAADNHKTLRRLAINY